MEHTFEEIVQAALSLPDPDRSRLVDRLNESLAEPSTDASAMDAWTKLVATRLESVRSGASEIIDGPAGLKAMRERVRG